MASVVQVYPSRISITPQRKKKSFHDMDFNRQSPSWYRSQKSQAVKNFQGIKNPFNISKASKRKMMDSINSMYMLSNPRTINMKNNKQIFNYKMSFITLTLPSKQAHSDTVIKHQALNQFLIELRKNYDIQNYVWKAELQKNDNIHFHLLLDKYVDFQALRRRWNRCINKLGYVDKYQAHMQKMSLTDYHSLRNKNGKASFDDSSKAYAKGKACNWSNPNSVDVRSVYGKRQLASYLAKYITKSFNNEAATGEELKRQLAFGRSWSRSYSLVQLKYQNKYLLEHVQPLIRYLREETKHVKQIIGDFFTVFYFSASNLNLDFQTFHKKFMFGNAETYRYPLPY